ncbi:DUF5804 family protein [Halorientalis marina]|uniref:DUF5804 family protein n=1 Tax=Halorientalis marina TaxID=2931976 RepID=UPI001FF5FE2E|nr:DUF5804 family protein [Halorientalis marina]
MAQVCLVGDPEVNLRYELLSRETARDALATYDLREPYENTVAVETVSLGSAVALLNDLNWYLVRFARDAFVREESVSETEWLSRAVATGLRDDAVDPEETDRFLKLYGVVDEENGADDDGSEGEDGEESEVDGEGAGEDAPPELVEPMYVTRTGRSLPEYDLRPVTDTLTVRVTEEEFGGERQR